MMIRSFPASLLIPILVLIPALSLHAQEADEEKPGSFEIEGYAVVNYHKYWWQTDPARRANVDIERLAVEPSYQLSKNIRLEAEVEFEHGGTGASMEFDRFEEFGEYEQEIEKGGEVSVEKVAAVIAIAPELNVRIGHFYVPIGLINSNYEPSDYFTTQRSEAEAALIPSTWHETGVELFGMVGPLRYQALVVNGLDATGFTSSTWIVRGHQGRFEMVNAENLAFAGRLDYPVGDEGVVGLSGYFGNSADNRPKPDLTVPAHVAIGDFHASLVEGPLTVRGVLLYGTLQNAGQVSKANRSLSNNLNAKRTPVGSAALGAFVEAGYDILSFFPHAPSDTDAPQRLDIFGRFDYYDSMFETDEEIFDNPRWERRVWRAGINWHLHPQLVLKGEFVHRTLGLPSDNREESFSLGMGFQL